MERLCKCGCGKPAVKGPRARYAEGHFKIMAAINKRLRIMRDWAKRRGIDFSLTANDLKFWFIEDDKFVPGIHLERIEKDRGFEPGNLKVKNLKALTRHAAEIAAAEQEEHK